MLWHRIAPRLGGRIEHVRDESQYLVFQRPHIAAYAARDHIGNANHIAQNALLKYEAKYFLQFTIWSEIVVGDEGSTRYSPRVYLSHNVAKFSCDIFSMVSL